MVDFRSFPLMHGTNEYPGDAMTCYKCTHPIPDAPPLRQDYGTTEAYGAAFKEWRRDRKGQKGCRCKRCEFCWDLIPVASKCVTCPSYPFLKIVRTKQIA